jgi:hypothetical protein
MPKTQIPHFDYPFRWSGDGHASVNEQDSLEDVAACVACVIFTPIGYRTMIPNFGSEGLEFTLPDADSRQLLKDYIVRSEPRADATTTDDIDTLDEFIDNITVNL